MSNVKQFSFLKLFFLRIDLLHPENNIIFKMSHFKRNLNKCGIFFDLLTNLNKLVAFE